MRNLQGSIDPQDAALRADLVFTTRTQNVYFQNCESALYAFRTLKMLGMLADFHSETKNEKFDKSTGHVSLYGHQTRR